MADAPARPRRARRQCEDGVNAQAVRLVPDGSAADPPVARGLGLTEPRSAGRCVGRGRLGRAAGPGLRPAGREELAPLRKANRVWQEERGILQRAPGSFAARNR